MKMKRPSDRMLNILTGLIGVLSFALGVAWLVRSWIVDLEVPYFAIPLVFALPVILAVTFRNFWNDE